MKSSLPIKDLYTIRCYASKFYYGRITGEGKEVFSSVICVGLEGVKKFFEKVTKGGGKIESSTKAVGPIKRDTYDSAYSYRTSYTAMKVKEDNIYG